MCLLWNIEWFYNYPNLINIWTLYLLKYVKTLYSEMLKWNARWTNTPEHHSERTSLCECVLCFRFYRVKWEQFMLTISYLFTRKRTHVCFQHYILHVCVSVFFLSLLYPAPYTLSAVVVIAVNVCCRLVGCVLWLTLKRFAGHTWVCASVYTRGVYVCVCVLRSSSNAPLSIIWCFYCCYYFCC